MQHSLPLPLPDFSKSRLLVVGDVMLDRYYFGDTARISPEAPVPIVHISHQDHRPGGAGNVALNIASLGGDVTLLSMTGDDEPAHTLLQQLNAAFVKSDFVMIKSHSTIIKLRVISRHQQLLRLDFESPFLTHQDSLLKKFQSHLDQVQFVILSDYRKGTLAESRKLIQLARNKNITVLVDPKSHDFSIYQHANVITPNFKEFERIVGPCRSEKEIHEKGEALLKQFQIEAIVITRGENGITVIDRHDTFHIPAFAREVFDVTGAGDTVIGTLALSLASGMSLSQSATLANIAASLVVNKLGAATVTRPELEAALSQKTNLNKGIMNEEQLLLSVKAARARGKKIVFTNGCFDIIHAGHVASLELAKQLGDYLIVAVNSDESVRQLKGKHRPINHLEHRMKVLAGFDAVDWVVPFSDDTPERLLQLIQPDILAKGSDYTLDQVVGANIVRAYGGEVRIVTHNIKTSSTHVFNQLQTSLLNEED